MSSLNKKNGNLRGIKGVYFDNYALIDEGDLHVEIQGWPVIRGPKGYGFVLVVDSEAFQRRLEITLSEDAIVRIENAVNELRASHEEEPIPLIFAPPSPPEKWTYTGIDTSGANF